MSGDADFVPPVRGSGRSLVLSLHAFPNGRLSAHGAVLPGLGPGIPPDALVVQGALATCADTNNDGVAGFSGALVLFRDGSGKGDIRGMLVPEGGDIAVSGRYRGALRLEDGSEPIAVHIIVRWAGSLKPRATPSR